MNNNIVKLWVIIVYINMMFNNITNNIIVMLTIMKIMVDQDYCYEKSRSDTLNSIPNTAHYQQ